MDDAISQEITINAPIQIVWDVVTKPEHVAKWFAEMATYELQPGAKGSLGWSQLGSAPVEIVTVDQPHTFAFYWVAPDEETKGTDGKTLITFSLMEVDGGTQVQVTESGFEKLALTDAEKTSLIDKHTSGWPYFLGKLHDYAEHPVPKA